jgi:hypothetical protein
MSTSATNPSQLKIGDRVQSTEHLPITAGTVLRLNAKGDATIEWETPRCNQFPYGAINTEFWPLADQKDLVVL